MEKLGLGNVDHFGPKKPYLSINTKTKIFFKKNIFLKTTREEKKKKKKKIPERPIIEGQADAVKNLSRTSFLPIPTQSPKAGTWLPRKITTFL